jgi:Rgg/GadR/MutR family transcriptional activator
MENNLGKCFKLLRESKGLSQKEIAGEVISIAQLSRFERGVSNINADTLYQCLENMNVSIAEFQCVCRNYLQNQTLLFQDEVAKAYIEKNTLTLKHYLVKCQQLEASSPHQKFYKLNTIIVKAVLQQCDKKEKVAKKDVQFLVDYLFSVEEWGRYELWLFTYSASLMTSNLVETFACEMINRTQFYQEIPENRRLVNQMLFNVINVCIERSRFSLAFKLLNYADNLKKDETDLFIRNAIKYCRGYYLFKTGNLSGLQTMEKCAEIMMFLECHSIAQQMLDRISELKQETSYMQKELTHL